MNIAFWKETLNQAITTFKARDFELVENRTSERCICHRLAVYLENQLEHQEVNIDCEYNRNGEIPKSLSLTNRKVLPDIIVHKRNQNINHLIIEAKYSDLSSSEDRIKVKGYIEELGYKFGLIISIPSRTGEDFNLQWWTRSQDGQATCQNTI